MSPEQTKVREFFKRFIQTNWRSAGMWFVEGFMVLIFLIACVMPVQEYISGEADLDRVMYVFYAFLGPAIAVLRVQPYTNYMENQKGRQIFDLLKYYPVEKKEIKKMKTMYMLKFMAKLLPVCMIAQVPATLWSYGPFTWINVLFIIAVAFVWPVLWGLVAIWTER